MVENLGWIYQSSNNTHFCFNTMLFLCMALPSGTQAISHYVLERQNLVTFQVTTVVVAGRIIKEHYLTHINLSITSYEAFTHMK